MLRSLIGLMLLAAPAAASTLDAARARGHLICGVEGDLPGFSAPDPQGVMRGFDADFCRAIAAAVFGDAGRLRFLRHASPDEGLDGLVSGRIDLLAGHTPLTLTRDAGRPIMPGPVLFFDGVGFLVEAGFNRPSSRDLGAMSICWAGPAGSPTGVAVAGFRQSFALTGPVRRFDQPAQAVAAMQNGGCGAYAADQAQLYTQRVTDFERPEAWRVLPEVISQRPLTPFIRTGDDGWREIVFWTAQLLIQAEQTGISQANLVGWVTRPDPTIRRVFGLTPGFGAPLRLADDWAARVIEAVGNYGDIFERNLGEASIFDMERGLNAQWTQGGLIYGMPLR